MISIIDAPRGKQPEWAAVQKIETPPTPATEIAKPTTPETPKRILTLFEQRVAPMAPEDQIDAVCQELQKRHPKFDPKRTRHRIEGNAVVMFETESEHLEDLTPIRAFPDLTELIIVTANYREGKLKSLAGLRGMKLQKIVSIHNQIADLVPLVGMPLKHLCVWTNHVTDLSPLRGMPLEHLNCGDGPVSDLKPLAGMQLKEICLNYSLVEDLTPLRGMPLQEILLENMPVRDLSPLEGMPLVKLAMWGTKQLTDHSAIRQFQLTEITLDFDPDRHTELLKGMKTLQRINAKPAAEFWDSVKK